MNLKGWDWISSFSFDRLNEKLEKGFDKSHFYKSENDLGSMNVLFDIVKTDGAGSQKHLKLILDVREGDYINKNTNLKTSLTGVSMIVKIPLSFFSENLARKFGIRIQSEDDIIIVNPDKNNKVINITDRVILSMLIKKFFLQERKMFQLTLFSIILSHVQEFSMFYPVRYECAALTLSNGQQFLSIFVVTKNKDISKLSTVLDTSLLSGPGEYLFVDVSENSFYQPSKLGVILYATDKSDEEKIVADVCAANSPSLRYLFTLKFLRNNLKVSNSLRKQSKETIVDIDINSVADLRMGDTYRSPIQRGSANHVAYLKW